MLLDFMTSQTIAVNTMIKRLSNYGEPQEDFLFSNINEFKNGDKRAYMLKAWDYYCNKNDIKDNIRYYTDRKGVRREAKNLTNTKLTHPFIKKLTKQKINYLLKKPPTFKCEENEAFLPLVKEYFNKQFWKKMKSVARDSIVKGIAWIQVYYDANGELSFKRIPTEQVIPFWVDEDHTLLDGIIRFYNMTLYNKDGSTEVKTKVEYVTKDGVWFYEMGKTGLIPDPDKGSIEEPGGHFSVLQNKVDSNNEPVLDGKGNQLTEEISAVWGKIPFVAFKYNAEEIPLLQWTKSLIDDYDTNTSDTSNNLQDIPNSIKVVKNYDGTSKEEFTENLNTFRTAFVSEDGDMKSLETKLDVASMDSHLDRTRKDIFVAGNGVDTQETDLGNASGIALQFRTMDLETDMEDMGDELSAGLEELLWFVKLDLQSKGKGDYSDVNVDTIFNLSTVVNKTDIADIAAKSTGIISEKTIIANHPWVEDVDAEVAQFKLEQKQKQDEEMALAKKMGDTFGTNEPNKGGGE